MKPGERWVDAPPDDHTVAWLAVSHGALTGDHWAEQGQLAVFEGGGPVELRASEHVAVFVIASAVPHPHDLVTGDYSVHTSAQALRDGEANIERLKARLPVHAAGARTAVFRG